MSPPQARKPHGGVLGDALASHAEENRSWSHFEKDVDSLVLQSLHPRREANWRPDVLAPVLCGGELVAGKLSAQIWRRPDDSVRSCGYPRQPFRTLLASAPLAESGRRARTTSSFVSTPPVRSPETTASTAFPSARNHHAVRPIHGRQGNLGLIPRECFDHAGFLTENGHHSAVLRQGLHEPPALSNEPQSVFQ